MSISVPPEMFYGPPSTRQNEIEKLLKKKPLPRKLGLPPYLKGLLGPSRTWKVFSKQQDALHFTKDGGKELMAFAFEHGTGQRSFLACHPIMLWFIGMQRCQNKRCTYEIIQETSKCKLYLDLEYEIEYNLAHDGKRMVETVIVMVCHKLYEQYRLNCSRNKVLDLDSSTNTKFSRHLIFQLEYAAFENNYAAGNFVKSICSEINGAVTNEELMHQTCIKYCLLESQVQELLITDRKGIKKHFIDEGVYTRNRHFRLLGSTKLHKNSPLVISESNIFNPMKKEEYAHFLSSLVTYFDNEIRMTLNFGPIIRSGKQEMVPRLAVTDPNPILQPSGQTGLEDFIRQIIQPKGRIRRRVQAGHEIIFDIVGYRFCSNIGREHKSNNIKLVVDLEHFVVYQSCYDPDCKGYQSPQRSLPSHLLFLPEDETVLLEAVDNIVSAQILLELLNDCDDSAFFEQKQNGNDSLVDILEQENSLFFNVRLNEIDHKENDFEFEPFEFKSDVNIEQSFSDLSDADLICVAESADLNMFDIHEDSIF